MINLSAESSIERLNGDDKKIYNDCFKSTKQITVTMKMEAHLNLTTNKRASRTCGKAILIFVYFVLHISFACLTGGQVYSQTSITWNRIYDGGFNMNDYVLNSCKTLNGNYVLVGFTSWHETMILKIDQFGVPVWMKHYWAGSDAVIETNDSGYIITPDFFKINKYGDSIYYKNYNLSNNNLYDIKKTTDGGYIMCGGVYYDSGFVMKTDSIGNPDWFKIISILNNRTFFAKVELAINNGFILTGRAYAINSSYRLIYRYDNFGNLIWHDISNEDSLGIVSSISKINQNYLFLTSRGFIRMDDNGNVINNKIIKLDTQEAIIDSKMINFNKFVTVSSVVPAQPPNWYSKIRIIDTNCITHYSKNFYNYDFIRLRHVILADNGDFVFTGDIDTNGNSGLDFYAVRTDSMLNYPPIEIIKLSSMISKDFILYQNYPNPFNPSTKIKFAVPEVRDQMSEVRLVVYDILGREVATLVNERLQPGTYEVDFDGSKFASGVYFYRIEAGQFTNVKKMVILK